MTIPEKDMQQPRCGMWDRQYSVSIIKKVYSDPTTAILAGKFLNQSDIITVEDWGCGYGGFENYVGQHQEYIGIDGSCSKAATHITDLELYSSDVDAIHMRHVIEHNPNWELVLGNAMCSFNKRMVLTLFTPFGSETQVINRVRNFGDSGRDMIDISFNRRDIVKFFETVKWTSQENMMTASQYGIEHIFFLEKKNG